MASGSIATSPVSPGERIQAMDVLRGFALCGILIVNIQSFSMIFVAGFNPSAYGDLNGLNGLVRVFTHVFAWFKFMAIFAIMYGAGIALLTTRIESKGISAAGVHYRRNFILIVVGALHGYLLWYGDILFWYGACALIVYVFRKIRPGRLVVIAAVFLLVPSLMMLVAGLSMPHWPPEVVEELRAAWSPDDATIRSELEAYRGGWIDQMGHRVEATLQLQSIVFLMWAFWRVSALMLIGMALCKWGVITARRSPRFYGTLAAVGLAAGVPIVTYGAVQDAARGWPLEYSKFLGTQYNYWGSLLMSLGYIGAVLVVAKRLGSSAVLRPLASVGRMAFTNYIMQTVICTTIFYGHGFGLFGKVQRTEQLLIVVCIWIFQLIVSPIWLKYFRFGPLEWVWRSLTYMRAQPMRVKAESRP